MNPSSLRSVRSFVCLIPLVLGPASLRAGEKREVSENTRQMWSILKERMAALDFAELKFLKNDQIAEQLKTRLKDAPAAEAAAVAKPRKYSPIIIDASKVHEHHHHQ